jgi:hypothetical protein
MALDFVLKDTIHKIIAKFYPASLPGAKKKYNARAVMQTELDIHGVASKASVYNITTSPKVIEEGFLAAVELIYYLTADGYKIKTPLFHASVRVPGEYDGAETHLPDGIRLEVKLTTDNDYRNYIHDHATVVFDGIEESNGLIGEVVDEATGLIDQVITLDNIVTITGYGLKIESDSEHANLVGVFLAAPNFDPIPVKTIALNEPRTLKVLIPGNLDMSVEYYLIVRTQSAVKPTGVPLKNMREMITDFLLTIQE